MKANYADGICRNVYPMRSAENSRKINEVPNEGIWESGNFAFSLIYDWGKLPELIKNYEVCNVACGKDGLIYVASRFRDTPIVVFDKDGNFVRYIGEGLEVAKIHGISVDDDLNIWYADVYNHVIRKIDQQGNLLMELGTFEKPSNSGADLLSTFEDLRYLSVQRMAGPFNQPTKLVTGKDGFLYASDGYCNVAVHKFDKNGTLIKSWGGKGKGPGEFALVHSLGVDVKNRVWVCDKMNNRIQVFDSDGKFITILDELMLPQDIAIDDSYAYVAETDNRISIYTMDFKLVSQIGGPDSEFYPHGIAVDSEGNLFLTQMNYNRHLVKLKLIRK